MNKILFSISLIFLSACASDFKMPPPRCQYMTEVKNPCDEKLMQDGEDKEAWSCKKEDRHFEAEEVTCKYFND